MHLIYHMYKYMHIYVAITQCPIMSYVYRIHIHASYISSVWCISSMTYHAGKQSQEILLSSMPNLLQSGLPHQWQHQRIFFDSFDCRQSPNILRRVQVCLRNPLIFNNLIKQIGLFARSPLRVCSHQSPTSQSSNHVQPHDLSLLSHWRSTHQPPCIENRTVKIVSKRAFLGFSSISSKTILYVYHQYILLKK